MACRTRVPRPAPDAEAHCPRCGAVEPLFEVRGPSDPRLKRGERLFRPTFWQRGALVAIYGVALAVVLVRATGAPIVTVGVVVFMVAAWLSLGAKASDHPPDPGNRGRYAAFRRVMGRRASWVERRWNGWWWLAVVLLMAGAVVALWRWDVAPTIVPAAGGRFVTALATVMLAPVMALFATLLFDLALLLMPLVVVYAVVITVALIQEAIEVADGARPWSALIATIFVPVAGLVMSDALRAGYAHLRDDGLGSRRRLALWSVEPDGPPDGPDHRTVTGVVTAAEGTELLEAPILREACLAWRLRGRDPHGPIDDARIVPALRLVQDDGRALDVRLDEVWLDVPATDRPSPVEALEEPHARFLRDRAVDPRQVVVAVGVVREGARVQLTATPTAKIVARGFRGDEETVLVGRRGGDAVLRVLAE